MLFLLILSFKIDFLDNSNFFLFKKLQVSRFIIFLLLSEVIYSQLRKVTVTIYINICFKGLKSSSVYIPSFW